MCMLRCVRMMAHVHECRYVKEGKWRAPAAAAPEGTGKHSKAQHHQGQRFAFASGCLQNHLLAGEERFSVEWDQTDDSVW